MMIAITVISVLKLFRDSILFVYFWGLSSTCKVLEKKPF